VFETQEIHTEGEKDGLESFTGLKRIVYTVGGAGI